MKIRSNIVSLAENIQASVPSWDGGENIQIGDIVSTITELNQDILKKLDRYEKIENSLNGRIETTEKLLKSLKSLKEKSINPDKIDGLTSVIRKVSRSLKLAIDLSKKNKISDYVENSIKFSLNDSIKSLEQKIKNCAYRTIKNIDASDELFMKNNKIGGSSKLSSFLSLKDDLEIFVHSYSDLLSDSQKSQINNAISVLTVGAERARKFEILESMHLSNVPNDSVESRIADYAFELEKSIENLEIGQITVVPGGYAGTESGHAVVYEIQRIKENEYSFSIFNTGMGADFAQDVITLIKIQNQDLFGQPGQSRVPIFTNLSKETIGNQKFLMSLIRYQVKKNPNNMDPIHKTIVRHLTESNSGKMSLRELHDLQTWGTCSFDSVSAFLEYYIHPSIFVPFQFDVMLRARGSLNSLLPEGKKSGTFPTQTIDFIEKKSCETLINWKSKYESYCSVSGDLKLAQDLNQAKVFNENDFKIFLNKLIDEVWDLNQILVDVDTDLQRSCEMVMTFAATGSLLPPPMSAAMGLGITANWLHKYTKALSHEKFGERERKSIYLSYYHDAILKISPKEIEILKNRQQSMGFCPRLPFSQWTLSDCQPNKPVIHNLELGNVLNYFKNRFAEISLCAPLLSANLSPMLEASTTCKMLGTS